MIAPPSSSAGSPLFATTRWSVVLAAKDLSSPEGAQALEALCRVYWYPLYAFVRASGRSPADAEDLIQEFFARLIARDGLRVVDPEKGRFRTFLRMAVRRFLANDRERRTARKRGGGATHLSMDTALAERLIRGDARDASSPDQAYDRRWALTLLQAAGERLAGQYAGRERELQVLQPWLTADRGQIPYATLATALGVTEGAVRVALHRMRRRFRDAFRQTVADTVASEHDVEEEMRHLIAILGEEA